MIVGIFYINHCFLICPRNLLNLAKFECHDGNCTETEPSRELLKNDYLVTKQMGYESHIDTVMCDRVNTHISPHKFHGRLFCANHKVASATFKGLTLTD